MELYDGIWIQVVFLLGICKIKPPNFAAFLSSRKSESMYHAMGYSSILVMQAAMTFDAKDMDAAMTSLREALQVCQRYPNNYNDHLIRCKVLGSLWVVKNQFLNFFRFRKKTGLMESLANLWYRQPADNLTEGE